MTDLEANTGADSGQLWSILTTVVLAATVLVVIFYMVVLISPSLFPFGKSQPKLVALINTPTPEPAVPISPTPLPPPATFTPEPTRVPEATATRRPPPPSRTPRPTLFFTPIPTETGTPTPTRHPFPFKLSDAGVEYRPYPFSASCDWLGIAGEVVNQEGEPVLGIPVVLNGGGLQNVVKTSGDRPDYAPSGWEHFLDSKIKVGTFTIQLFRVVGNQSFPISDLVEIITRQDCRANLAYLTFELAWEDYQLP